MIAPQMPIASFLQLKQRHPIKGTSKNSGFFATCFCAPAKQAYMPSMAITARKHRAENRSVHEVHQDRPGLRTSTELMYMDVRYVGFAGAQKSVTPQSREKCIFRGVLKCLHRFFGIDSKVTHSDITSMDQQRPYKSSSRSMSSSPK
jgi:hypothetical protein